MGTIEWVCVATYLVCAVLMAAVASTKNPNEHGLICTMGALWWLVILVLVVAVVTNRFRKFHWGLLFTPITWLGRTKLCVRLNELVEKIDLE